MGVIPTHRTRRACIASVVRGQTAKHFPGDRDHNCGASPDADNYQAGLHAFTVDLTAPSNDAVCT